MLQENIKDITEIGILLLQPVSTNLFTVFLLPEYIYLFLHILYFSILPNWQTNKNILFKNGEICILGP